MGRITKNTVDYFPHFTGEGKTKFILQNRFGNDGYAFWFKLLEMLCKADGHFIDCRNASQWEYLLAEMRLGPDITEKLLYLLVEIGQVDKELWESRVIWCQNLVDNLSNIYQNRKRNLPEKPVITVETTAEPNNYCKNDSAAPISTVEMRARSGESTHSIVEYSIVKYSKEKEKEKFLKEKEKSEKNFSWNSVSKENFLLEFTAEFLKQNPNRKIGPRRQLDKLENDKLQAVCESLGYDFMIDNIPKFFKAIRTLPQSNSSFYVKFCNWLDNFYLNETIKSSDENRKEEKKQVELDALIFRARSLVQKCLNKKPETADEKRFANDVLEGLGLLSEHKKTVLLEQKLLTRKQPGRYKKIWVERLEDDPRFEPYEGNEI